MSLQLAARHLASKGRGPDTQLVHMTTGELKSLQDLARAHGTSLTINPDTGLPEAFKLKSLLPLAAGLALGPAGLGLTAAQAGLAAGAIGTIAGGSLEKGIMAGLGAYGGAGLGAGLLGAGTAAAQQAAIASLEQGASQAAMNEAAAQATLAAQASPFETAMKGFGSLGSSAGRDAFMGSVGGGKGLLQYGLAAAAPLMVTPQPQTTTQMPGSSSPPPKYLFERKLNPPGSPTYFTDRYTRMAEGGSTSKYSGKRYMDSLGSSAYSAYDRPLPTTDEIITGTVGVDFEYVYDPITKTYKKVRKQKPGVADVSALPGVNAAGFSNSGGVGGMGGIGDYGGTTAGGFGYGMGDGGVGLIGLGQSLAGMGLTGIGNALAGYGIGQLGAAEAQAAADAAALSSMGAVAADAAAAAGINQGAADAAANDANSGDAAAAAAAGYAAADAVGGGSMTGGVDGGWGADGGDGLAKGGLAALSRDGISHLGDYSDGGRLLRGPGDGVSDSIPAVIGRKRPARLADGEFVVPARIVSELGNGSTEAGARKLYAMMDRVQRARGKTVGKGKVAKNTRADKYLPA